MRLVQVEEQALVVEQVARVRALWSNSRFLVSPSLH